MLSKDLYREETNEDVYSDDNDHASYSDKYVHWIEKKLEENQDKWISAKEFPEHDSSVLVAFDNGDVDHDWYDKEFNHWSILRHDTRKITHWQNLPTPPKQ